jgi:hypothetical protein
MARKGDAEQLDVDWLLNPENILRVMCVKCGHFLTEVATLDLAVMKLNCKTAECRRLNVLIVGRQPGGPCYIEKQWYEDRPPPGQRPRVESPG